MIIRNVTKDVRLCVRALVANTFWKRSAGMMLRPGWDELDGLLLTPCGSIHTLLMRMPIDVCFVDGRSKVVDVMAGLGPWRMAVGKRGSCSTLELPAGTLQRTGTEPGDELSFHPSIGHP